MPWVVETRLESETKLPADLVRVKQAHGGAIVWADEVTTFTTADGIATHTDMMRPFMIKTADCLPLVVTSPFVACGLHVSRKTLLRGLLDAVPEFIPPRTITNAFIGPHICAEHFVFEKIGDEIAAFREAYPDACRESARGLHLDIAQVVDAYLTRWQVPEGAVSRDGRCTFETVELPSYRRSLKNSQSLSDGIATIVRSA